MSVSERTHFYAQAESNLHNSLKFGDTAVVRLIKGVERLQRAYAASRCDASEPIITGKRTGTKFRLGDGLSAAATQL